MAKAGTFLSALYTVGLTVVFILVMFVFVRPFLAKIGRTYAHAEVINKSFVGFIFLVLIVSAVTTEIIGIHALFGKQWFPPGDDGEGGGCGFGVFPAFVFCFYRASDGNRAD